MQFYSMTVFSSQPTFLRNVNILHLENSASIFKTLDVNHSYVDSFLVITLTIDPFQI